MAEVDIPRQKPVPWAIALQVSKAGIKRRLGRSLITMVGVILAIAFLAHILITEAVNTALISLDNAELNIMLQRAGVDIFRKGGTDEMVILLTILTILTCMIGIINSMLMAVTERVKEIGTLKCLGARDQFIVKMYLIESSFQGIIGACIGLVLGTVVALGVALVNYGTFVFTGFPFLGILKAVFIAFTAGSLMSISASIIPAYAAARKQPVEALRVEE